MSDIAIKVENLSKQYRLGQIGTGTISHDLNRWWHQIRGKEDPYLKIGEANDRAVKGNREYVWALQDINFEVKQGEVLGIIGKNGAGKSTLLKILSKVTSPTTGSIKAKGRIASLLEVGTGFHPEMTGRENIFMNGTIMGMNRHEIRAKLDEIVEFAGVAKYLDTPVKRYSSGMTVRLGFAIAAHLEPEILIVDEVLAVGDAEFQKKAIGKMQDVSKGEGRTVLFVSHNMQSILNLCTGVHILHQGASDYYGSTQEGVRRYLNSAINIDGSLKNKLENQIINKFGFRICDFQFLNRHREQVTTALSGEELNIKIDFVSETTLSRVYFRLNILNLENGEVITVLNNYHSLGYFRDLKTGYVVCKIPKFNLTEGIVGVDLSVWERNHKLHEIPNIAKLKINTGDFYNTGQHPTVKSVFFSEHEWSIN